VPGLSIIVPVLNEEAGIAAALEPLADYRRSGHEVIVVDGGSTDRTADLAQPLADAVLTAPRGRAVQMNAGAAQAGGDILLFLHADTRLPASSGCLVIEGLRRSGRLWGRFDVTIAGRSPLLRVVATMMNLRSRLTGIATGDQMIFVTRDAFAACGGYPDIPLMEDIALSRRLKRLGPPLCLTARVTTSGRRWEQRGVIRTILLMWRLRLAYFLGAEPTALAQRYGYVPRED
jgi:rSAM/selenodomain-associated transferase 2